MSYNTLVPLIKKTKSQLSPEEFQERINVVFHDHEANHYDNIHKDMWESLQEQINLLIKDIFESNNCFSNNLRLLDIGCGTGLSTQLMLNSELEPHISDVTLLDSSSNMLKKARLKADGWNKNCRIVNGYVSDIKEKFDIVLICSVLHHIPDLKVFLNQVDNVLKTDGIIIHLQDPNGDFLSNPFYLERLEEFRIEMKSLGQNKRVVNIIPKKWKSFINRRLGRKNYIDLVNDQLLAEKVIKKRMSADEIWSVTDIHVESKNEYLNKGISFHFLKEQLENYTLINKRSYGFYGVLKSDLNSKYKEKEEKFISKNDLSGRNISCVWRKNK
jgi:ubiquinone/menaquinone biosynthesis C-methylase UbiE